MLGNFSAPLVGTLFDNLCRSYAEPQRRYHTLSHINWLFDCLERHADEIEDPARLAFAVASGTDSRVILDYTGAESLLGRGDMLFLNPEVGTPVRAQGVLITDTEIERIIAYWQKNWDTDAVEVPPWETLLKEPEEDEDDGLVEKAISIVRQQQRASASMLQRRLRIGYPRAARLLDQLETMGVVGPSQGGGKEREVLISDEDEIGNQEER